MGPRQVGVASCGSSLGAAGSASKGGVCPNLAQKADIGDYSVDDINLA